MQPEEQEAEDTKQESQEKQDEVIDIDSVNTIPKTIEKRGGIFERVTLKMNQFFEERFRNHKINKESQGLNDIDEQIQEITQNIDDTINKKSTEIEAFDNALKTVKGRVLRGVYEKNKDRKIKQFDAEISKLKAELKEAQTQKEDVNKKYEAALEMAQRAFEEHNGRVDKLEKDKREEYQYEEISERLEKTQKELERHLKKNWQN